MKKLVILLFFSANAYSQTPGAGVMDIDGNAYATVIIGSQEWMAENLRTTKYANGDLIPNVTDGTQWSTLTTGAWVHYNNFSQNELPFGKLYNWFAVSDSRNVCPSGWHLPSEADWDSLIYFLDPNADIINSINSAGGKMKSIGTQYWISPNFEATNESGYSGLPGGCRTSNGEFTDFGFNGGWWSSDTYISNFAWYRILYYGYGFIGGMNRPKAFGFNIRCVKEVTPLGLIQLKTIEKELIKIIDLMGRETELKPDEIQIYMYSDGTYEKRYISQ